MSSNLLPPIHFNSVELGIYRAFFIDTPTGFNPYRYKELSIFKIKDPQELIGALMDEIRSLSALCISLQYKHHYQGKLDEEIERSQEELMSNKTAWEGLPIMGLYKAIQSIEYQIETKHLIELRGLTEPEEVALSWIKKVEGEIAERIINQLPEYRGSKWVIE
jgi:hypothetical protein